MKREAHLCIDLPGIGWTVFDLKRFTDAPMSRMRNKKKTERLIARTHRWSVVAGLRGESFVIWETANGNERVWLGPSHYVHIPSDVDEKYCEVMNLLRGARYLP